MQSRASQGDKVLFWGYVALHVSSTLPWGWSPDGRGGPAAGGRSEAVPDPWGGGDRAGRVQWDRGGGERSWQGISSLQPSPRGQGQGSSRAPTARQQALGTHRVYSLLVSASRSLEIHSAALLTHYTSPPEHRPHARHGGRVPVPVALGKPDWLTSGWARHTRWLRRWLSGEGMPGLGLESREARGQAEAQMPRPQLPSGLF